MLTERDLPAILAEYTTEETERLKRINRQFHRLDEEMERLHDRRLALSEKWDETVEYLLEIANEEGWEV